MLVALFGIALFGTGQVRPATDALWLDFDMKNIPEPKERGFGYYDYFFNGQVVEHAKQDLDIPRWVRKAAGRPKRAANINAWDEIPDSSWYTNRHHLHPMSIEQLVRGPDQGSKPDFKPGTITKAKIIGVSPGFWLKDSQGQSYLIKLDNVNYPRLQSGSEIIATKILYAAGYNVPENYLVYLDPNDLQIGEHVEVDDPKTGKRRPLTREDLDLILRRAARMPDGRYRATASKMLPGKPKGPFPQVGLRTDDPNDLIPHEHRRELRGLRIIQSWINNWDLKEGQSLDTYVEEKGRHFLRHYLLDFNSSLGVLDLGTLPDDEPAATRYYHGKEYGLDLGSITKKVLSLGTYKSAEEKPGLLISPEVGIFTSDDFDPEGWKPTFSSVMFDNLTDQDAFWATRIVLSFTQPELRSIIETADYSDPKDADYILRTLMERRQILARHWLSKVDGLSDFSIHPAKEGLALTFCDLMAANKLIDPGTTSYTYQIKGPHYKSEKKTVSEPQIVMDRDMLGAAIEGSNSAALTEITIWTNRPDSHAEPVKLSFDWNPARGSATIRRISRG